MAPKSRIQPRAGLTLLEALFLIFLFIVLPLLMRGPSFSEMADGQTRLRVSRVKADMRSLATAIEAYNTEHHSFPPMRPQSLPPNDTAESDRSAMRGLSTWGTPLPGVTLQAHDPFTFRREIPFAYHATNDQWILFSVGPDGVYDIRPELLADLWKDGSQGVTNRLSPLTYDPTNGTNSAGDIYRTRQVEEKRP